MNTGSAPATSAPAKQQARTVELARILARSVWSGKPDSWQEEVASRVMVKYAKHFPDTSSLGNTAAWLRRVVRTTGLDLHDADQTHPTEPLSDGSPVIPHGPAVTNWLQQAVTSGPGKKVARDDLLEQIFSLLPSDDADLIRWKHLNNLTAVEIAAELGSSEAAVNQRLCRARKALREALQERPDLVRELHAPMPQPF